MATSRPNTLVSKAVAIDENLNKIGLEVNYITDEINRRAEDKKEKNFELADQIRADLDSKGIILNDTINGTTWDIKELY